MLHRGPRKAESTLTCPLRTENVGLAAFLHACRALNAVLSGVSVRPATNASNILPESRLHQPQITESERYQEIPSTGKGFGAEQSTKAWRSEEKFQ